LVTTLVRTERVVVTYFQSLLLWKRIVNCGCRSFQELWWCRSFLYSLGRQLGISGW